MVWCKANNVVVGVNSDSVPTRLFRKQIQRLDTVTGEADEEIKASYF